MQAAALDEKKRRDQEAVKEQEDRHVSTCIPSPPFNPLPSLESPSLPLPLTPSLPAVQPLHSFLHTSVWMHK